MPKLTTTKKVVTEINESTDRFNSSLETIQRETMNSKKGKNYPE